MISNFEIKSIAKKSQSPDGSGEKISQFPSGLLVRKFFENWIRELFFRFFLNFFSDDFKNFFQGCFFGGKNIVFSS